MEEKCNRRKFPIKVSGCVNYSPNVRDTLATVSEQIRFDRLPFIETLDQTAPKSDGLMEKRVARHL
jgi:hypothetical protein